MHKNSVRTLCKYSTHIEDLTYRGSFTRLYIQRKPCVHTNSSYTLTLCTGHSLPSKAQVTQVTFRANLGSKARRQDNDDERQWLSAGYAWHSRPRTTTLSSNLRNGGDESGWAPLISIPEGLGAPWRANSRESSSRWVSAPRDDPPGVC